MKRTMLMVAVAAFCVAGSAMADSGGLIGSGTRSDDSGQVMGSGNAADQTMGSGGFTTSPQDSGQIIGSGTAVEIRQFDGFSLLVVSSDKGTFVIPIEE